MKESLIKKFIKYVSLSIIGTLAQSLYIIADTMFIARGVGSNGIAALNIALPIFGFMFGFGMMIGMGGGTRSSISPEKKNETFTICITSSAVISVLFSLAGLLFPNQIAVLLGANDEIKELTVTYLRVALLFAPAFMLNNTFVCFVRNDGNPHLSSAAMLSSSLANIVLDYVFIFPFEMGMFGAILATVISPIISLLILSFHFILKKNTFKADFRNFNFRFKKLFDISSLGISSFINEIANSIVVMVFNFIILGISGTVGISAYGIIANFSLMVINVFAGIAQGIQPLASSAYGHGRIDEIKKIYKYAIILSLIFSITLYIISFRHTDALISIFNKENNAELSSIVANGIKLYFIGFIFAGISIISSTLLSSAERATSAFVPSILRGFALIIPTAYVMSYLFKLNGVWLSFGVTEFLVMIVALCLTSVTFKKLKSPAKK